MEPKIIYEDDAICVVDKPSGMVADRDVREWFRPKLSGRKGEGEFGQKGGVVHRLDRDTSGVMVLAKTPGAYEELKKQFLERKVVKKYLAAVHGKFDRSEGVISANIGRIPKKHDKFGVAGNGRAAVTEWKAVRQLDTGAGTVSLLEVRPLTGRTHQIRVHLKHTGHPVVSDPVYGGRRQYKEDVKLCPRLWLHANTLEFAHPVTGKRMRFEARPPGELPWAEPWLG